MTSSTEKSEETVPLRSDAELHSDDESEETPRVSALQRQLAEDQRFNPAPPSRLKRAALIFLILGLFWLAFKLRPQKERPIVYASRYSKEHKFRPAASPIVTETLIDGRLKVRGAAPTTSATPIPTPKTFEEQKARALRRAKGIKKTKGKKSVRNKSGKK